MHRILHLSDTHLGASGFDADGVNALASLEQILFDCRWLPDIDLIVTTGDIADDGTAEGCQLVRARVGAFAAARGIPHIYTTGNHDRRPGFIEALGSGHLDPLGNDIGELLVAGDERAAVSVTGGLRTITLDSLVPDRVDGLISTAQLNALAAELALDGVRSDYTGTVLALHHPPIDAAIAPWTRDTGLSNPDELAAVLTGADVSVVLCGHLHLQLTGAFADTTVWATPGVVTRADLTAPGNRLRVLRGPSASIIDLTPGRPPTCYVVHGRDPNAGQEVLVVDPSTWELAAET
ncbi:MAG: metallophosphoesterase [Actinomycetota bacterium]|nr:metallophosphoesterase [Actinomycetota bacterium]MDQ2955980.1 metallophosphoesterase [Actinomycetota bacterium]